MHQKNKPSADEYRQKVLGFQYQQRLAERKTIKYWQLNDEVYTKHTPKLVLRNENY